MHTSLHSAHGVWLNDVDQSVWEQTGRVAGLLLHIIMEASDHAV